jgi:hypothetical protein
MQTLPKNRHSKADWDKIVKKAGKLARLFFVDMEEQRKSAKAKS